MAGLGEGRLGLESEAEPRLDELEELRPGPLRLQLGVVLGAAKPAGEELLARRITEDQLDQGARAAGVLLEEAGDVVVGQPVGGQHLVDVAVGEARAQGVARQALELRLVARAALLELHQDGGRAVAGDAEQVDQQRLGSIELDVGLDRSPEGEEGAVETDDVSLQILDPESRQPAAPRGGLQRAELVDEGLELPSRVVEHDDATLAQELVELAGEIAVEGVHGNLRGKLGNGFPPQWPGRHEM